MKGGRGRVKWPPGDGMAKLPRSRERIARSRLKWGISILGLTSVILRCVVLFFSEISDINEIHETHRLRQITR